MKKDVLISVWQSFHGMRTAFAEAFIVYGADLIGVHTVKSLHRTVAK